MKMPSIILPYITNSLKNEALSFIGFQKDLELSERVNAYMSKYTELYNFEQFGLYFDDSKIVKLNKIFLKNLLVAMDLILFKYM